MKPLTLSDAFRADCRGNVAMMYALMLPTLIFGAGFAIDYTHAMQVQTKLDAIADSAALAALTPSMMKQNNAVAQATATQMFTSQASAIDSLVNGDTAVTVSVTNPNNNSLIRSVKVSYTAANQNIFAGVLGAPTLPLKGSSTAQAQLAANIDFYLLLDNSPSMALPATQDGVNSMISLTPQQANGAGCMFTCHQANTGNGNLNTAGNPYWNPSTQLTCAPNRNGSYASGCVQMDDYQLAKTNKIPMRLDMLNSGVTALMATAQQTQTQSGQNPPPRYQFAVDSMDSAYARGFTKLMALTANYQSGWTAASPSFQLQEMWDENQECATNGSNCTAGVMSDDTDTNFDGAMSSVNSQMPTPGNGTNDPADKPQEILFIVTDGVTDEVYNGSCSQPLVTGYGVTRCQEPVNTTYCDTIKSRGIRIAVLYTTYYPAPSQTWYAQHIAPFQSQIATNLQKCASDNLFYEAKLGDDLGQDLSNLFVAATKAARLTQ